MVDAAQLQRDQMLTDLGRKVANDVTACVERVSSLIPDASAGMVIALSAAAPAVGLCTGFAQIMAREIGLQENPEDLADGIWDLLRPMVLKHLGGSDADFRALLASLREKGATSNG